MCGKGYTLTGAFATLYKTCRSTPEDILGNSLECPALALCGGYLLRVIPEAHRLEVRDHLDVIRQVLIGFHEKRSQATIGQYLARAGDDLGLEAVDVDLDVSRWKYGARSNEIIQLCGNAALRKSRFHGLVPEIDPFSQRMAGAARLQF